MPDWVFHIGLTFILLKIFRQTDIRWFLLGAILPDTVAMAAYVIVDYGSAVIPLDPLWAHTCLHMYHTPYIMLLSAGICGLLSSDFKKVFFAVTAGSFFHIFCDLFQKTAGGGSAVLFPFYIKNFSLQVFWYPFKYTTLINISFILIMFFYFAKTKGKYTTVSRRFSGPKLFSALLILAAIVITPLLTAKTALRNNLNNSGFISDPAQYKNKPVALAVSRVVAHKTNSITVTEQNACFRVTNITNNIYQTGVWVSIRGIYSNRLIYKTTIIKHNYSYKILFSLTGLVLLMVFWFYYQKDK